MPTTTPKPTSSTVFALMTTLDASDTPSPTHVPAVFQLKKTLSLSEATIVQKSPQFWDFVTKHGTQAQKDEFATGIVDGFGAKLRVLRATDAYLASTAAETLKEIERSSSKFEFLRTFMCVEDTGKEGTGSAGSCTK